MSEWMKGRPTRLDRRMTRVRVLDLERGGTTGDGIQKAASGTLSFGIQDRSDSTIDMQRGLANLSMSNALNLRRSESTSFDSMVAGGWI